MKFILLSLFSYIVLTSSACSPAKGYLGPELPEEKLAIVSVNKCDKGLVFVRASAEGVEFNTNGIQLLPGKRSIDVSVERPAPAYNCVAHSDFDQLGYDLCLGRRQEAINKQEKYIPDCFYSDYTDNYNICLQPFQAFLCSVSSELAANKKYEVCAYQDYNNIKVKLSDQNLALGLKDCIVLDTEVRTVRFD